MTAATASTRILIVGAGFAGAVHARELADAGYHVDVIDRRPHIAGNAYDKVHTSGTRVHVYGPHLFHTNNEAVVDWVQRFGTFVPYEHRVEALLPDRGLCVPLPVNRRTINAIYNTTLTTDEQTQAFLREVATPIEAPKNAGEYLTSQIGPLLTDLFFRRYTRKMWGIELEGMDAAVVKRIPIRTDENPLYFPTDRFQILPRDGYTEIFRAILDHPNIRVTLNQDFTHAMRADYRCCFNSMAIDEYFDFSFGRLPYRSIRFHHREEPESYGLGDTSVVNFTDLSPFTRQTDWSRLPYHRTQETGRKTLTIEEPCDYTENNFERYYPIKNSDGQFDSVYHQYRDLAALDPTMHFIGRCGTYQYLDMHQVINQSLKSVRDWIAAAS